MSKEYIAPAVVFRGLTGTGTRVSSRRALSAPASTFVCPPFWFGPALLDWLFPPLLPLLADGPLPPFCACATGRISKETRAPMLTNLAHRAIEPHRDVVLRIRDISSSLLLFVVERCARMGLSVKTQSFRSVHPLVAPREREGKPEVTQTDPTRQRSGSEVRHGMGLVDLLCGSDNWRHRDRVVYSASLSDARG